MNPRLSGAGRAKSSEMPTRAAHETAPEYHRYAREEEAPPQPLGPFDYRVTDAREMYLAGRTRREIQEKHGAIVLRHALEGMVLRDLVASLKMPSSAIQ